MNLPGGYLYDNLTSLVHRYRKTDAGLHDKALQRQRGSADDSRLLSELGESDLDGTSP